MDAREERAQLDAVAQRLSSRFSGLSPRIVVEAVRTAEAGLRAAFIRDFVPLLVEKEARDRLAALIRQPDKSSGQHETGDYRSHPSALAITPRWPRL